MPELRVAKRRRCWYATVYVMIVRNSWRDPYHRRSIVAPQLGEVPRSKLRVIRTCYQHVRQINGMRWRLLRKQEAAHNFQWRRRDSSKRRNSGHSTTGDFTVLKIYNSFLGDFYQVQSICFYQFFETINN